MASAATSLALLLIVTTATIGEESGEDEKNQIDSLVKELNEKEENADIVLTVGEMVDLVKIGGVKTQKVASSNIVFPVSKQVNSKDVFAEFGNPVTKNLQEEKRCVEKVVLEKETEWDREVECHHRYRNHCYKTYSTTFKPVQVQECVENYKKNCFIEYGLDAVNHTVRVCRKPLEKDCSIEGEEICSTHFETECWTRQLRQKVEDEIPDCRPIVEMVCKNHTIGYLVGQECSEVTRLECSIKKKVSFKFRPVAECKLSPVELCGPRGCGVREGREICEDRRTLVVYDKPEETCNLEPVKTCQMVTKLVPQLAAREKCVDIPLEICVSYITNPQEVNKPVVKIWCYKSKQ